MAIVSIEYTKVNIFRCGEVRLIPGVNQVNADDWDAIKENPFIIKMVADKEIVLKNSKGEEMKPVVDKVTKKKVLPEAEKIEGETLIADMSPKEAKDLIARTLDHSLLKKWKEEEKRKAVLAAIEEQMAAVLPEEKKDDDEE